MYLTKMQNNTTITLIILAGLVGGYIFHTSVPVEVLIEPPLGGRVDDLSKFSNITLNFSDLGIESIDALKIFGEQPVIPGPTGKQNIFAPI